MKNAAIFALFLPALMASAAQAQPASSSETDELRAELDALRERLDELESESDGPAGSVLDSIEISGDLRYRNETINDDFLPYQNRDRIRARLRIDADVADNVTFNLTLATGASNPVSANQTLGGGFSRKDIGVDRAYFDWTVTDAIGLRGGKMANPLYRAGGHHLIFDGDLNPEGLALSVESGSAFLNIGGFWADERGGAEDALLAAFQGGFESGFGNAELTIGASYYDYSNTQGFAPFYLGIGAGNSLDANGDFLYDYNLFELFADITWEIGGHAVRLFVDAVENTEVDQFERGYAVGGRWRSASDPGDWEVRYAYQDLEADAVMAIFSDSDFGGGGSDNKGHEFRGSYILRNGINLTGTYFVNERGEAAGALRDYNRLQLDVNFEF